MQSERHLNPTPVLLWGTGALPETVATYLNHASEGKYAVAGFTCDRTYVPDPATFMGLPVLPFERERLEQFAQRFSSGEGLKLLFPVGYRHCNRLRQEKYEEAKSWGFDFITYIHPTVRLLPNVTVGPNSVIFEYVTLQPGVETGHSCLIWSGAIIGHQSRLGSCCWLAGGSRIAGQCTVGDRVFFGLNSSVRDQTYIADDCIIGMAAAITRDTKRGEVYLAGVNKRFFKKSDKVEI